MKRKVLVAVVVVFLLGCSSGGDPIVPNVSGGVALHGGLEEEYVKEISRHTDLAIKRERLEKYYKPLELEDIVVLKRFKSEDWTKRRYANYFSGYAKVRILALQDFEAGGYKIKKGDEEVLAVYFVALSGKEKGSKDPEVFQYKYLCKVFVKDKKEREKVERDIFKKMNPDMVRW